jgi:hypothetical protein
MPKCAKCLKCLNLMYSVNYSKGSGSRGPGFGPPQLPARRAYSSERGVILMVTFTLQCSGVRCQQPKSTRWIEDAHKMDFLYPVLASSCNAISRRDSGFDFY